MQFESESTSLPTLNISNPFFMNQVLQSVQCTRKPTGEWDAHVTISIQDFVYLPVIFAPQEKAWHEHLPSYRCRIESSTQNNFRAHFWKPQHVGKSIFADFSEKCPLLNASMSHADAHHYQLQEHDIMTALGCLEFLWSKFMPVLEGSLKQPSFNEE